MLSAVLRKILGPPALFPISKDIQLPDQQALILEALYLPATYQLCIRLLVSHP